MKTRPLISQHLRALGPLACGLMVTVLAASPIRAAPSDTAKSASSQMLFVDLNAQGSATPQSAVTGRSATASANAGTMFIDLTTGAAPTAIADSVLKTKTPPMRIVDLTNGASPPPVEDGEDGVGAVPAPETTII